MLKKIFFSTSLLIVLYLITNIFLLNDSSKLSYLKSKISIEKKQIIKKYFFRIDILTKLKNIQRFFKRQ